MKVSVISDIHVHPNDDKGLEILRKFCADSRVLDSDYVIFLGDIFDLLAYEKHEFLTIYGEAFDLIEKLSLSAKNVIFVEGNHDFLFRKVLEKSGKSIFSRYCTSGFQILNENQNYIFCHGDLVEIDNYGYQIYRSLIRSRLFRNLFEYVIPFTFIWNFGNRLLKKSAARHYEYRKKDYQEKIKLKFRKSADIFFRKNDLTNALLVCGHSHVKDLYRNGENVYINNGFAQFEGTFLYIEKENFSFKEL